MKRRSFFQLLFGALLAKWLPKHNPNIPLPLSDEKWRLAGIDPMRVDTLDLSKWGQRQYVTEFVTRAGYKSPPSYAFGKIPLGPPNVTHRIVRFD